MLRRLALTPLGLLLAFSCLLASALAHGAGDDSASDRLELVLARELASPPKAVEPVAPVTSALPLSPGVFVVLVDVLLFVAANVALLLLASIVTRVLRERRLARRERFRVRWEPVLHARMAGDAIALPALRPSERLLFLSLWLHLLGYVRGEAADSLVLTAQELGLAPYVLKLLDARAGWKRVLAMQAAAALRLKEARETLFAKAVLARPRSSLYAARALLEIDPERGVAALGHLLNHVDWSPAAMIEVAKGAAAHVGPMLVVQLRAAAPGRAKQLVRLIELLGDAAALPALRERLLFDDEGEIAVILHCLAKLGGAQDRITALGLLSHGSAVVRLQAAHALGALGLAEDAERLIPLLRDRNWWVRYRAAQALLRLAGTAAAAAARNREVDPYAREMVERVLAESGEP